MSRLWSIIAGIPRQVLIGIARAYQLLISPLSPSTCRFQPTCSAYAIEALRRYGFWKGLVLSIYRLGRCHPWGGHGYDPPRWFGESKPEESSLEKLTRTSSEAPVDAEMSPADASDRDIPATDESRTAVSQERAPAPGEEEQPDATDAHSPAAVEPVASPTAPSTDTQSSPR